MTAPWYISLICKWRGHDTPIWKFTAQGTGFLCPTCGRFRVSKVLKELS